MGARVASPERKRVWLHPLLWAIYAYVVSIVIAGLSNAPLETYQDKPANASNRAASPFLSLIADLKPILMVGFVAIAGVPGIHAARKAMTGRRNARLDMIRRYLRMVQARSFPLVDGTTSSVRISLFVLSSDNSRLECLYRTDDKAPKRSWLIANDEGFVVRAFRYQVTFVVRELDETLPDDKQRYLTESWSTPEIFEDRSWMGPTMLGIPIVVRPGEQPVAVFLIEAKGTKLASNSLHDADAETCCMLMEELQ